MNKHGMQCKDIPTRPILLFLLQHYKPDGWSHWCNMGFRDDEDVRRAMPDWVPYKLALAKMRQLLHKKLVDGCGCGCRGDWVLTDHGLTWLLTHPPTSTTHATVS